MATLDDCTAPSEEECRCADPFIEFFFPELVKTTRIEDGLDEWPHAFIVFSGWLSQSRRVLPATVILPFGDDTMTFGFDMQPEKLDKLLEFAVSLTL